MGCGRDINMDSARRGHAELHFQLLLRATCVYRYPSRKDTEQAMRVLGGEIAALETTEGEPSHGRPPLGVF